MRFKLLLGDCKQEVNKFDKMINKKVQKDLKMQMKINEIIKGTYFRKDYNLEKCTQIHVK